MSEAKALLDQIWREAHTPAPNLSQIALLIEHLGTKNPLAQLNNAFFMQISPTAARAPLLLIPKNPRRRSIAFGVVTSGAGHHSYSFGAPLANGLIGGVQSFIGIPFAVTLGIGGTLAGNLPTRGTVSVDDVYCFQTGPTFPTVAAIYFGWEGYMKAGHGLLR